MTRIIMHIDLNAFFATCEEIRNPSLKGKPVLIGHPGRSGIVSTASYPARKYGCHSGQPMFQALEQCPEAIVIPPDFDYYQVMSNSFRAYIQRFSKIYEAASIDECYVDMTKPLFHCPDPTAYLRNLQNGLLEETGLKCSIGIAPTKWLAKMASDMKKPMGLVFLRRRDLESVLYPLPIESFWGIGKKTSPRLKAMGILTIGDLAKRANAEDPALIEEMGKFFYVIKDWVNGYGSDEIDMTPFDPKSIGNSETLMHDSDTEAEIAPVIRRLSDEVAGRARAEKKVGYTISLVVKDTQFKLHNKSVTFHEATNDADTIYDKCLNLYRNYFLGMLVRLVGVTLEKLSDPTKETVQMSFWNYEKFEEQDRTRLLINELNRKLDKPILLRASEAKKGTKNGNR
jgi:DNA polymerase-4